MQSHGYSNIIYQATRRSVMPPLPSQYIKKFGRAKSFLENTALCLMPSKSATIREKVDMRHSRHFIPRQRGYMGGGFCGTSRAPIALSPAAER